MSEQLVLDLKSSQDDHFVEGIANELARSSLRFSGNVLITGETRSGKTRICDRAVKHFGALELLSVEKIDQHIASGTQSDIAIDDADIFIGETDAQKSLFHLFNLLKSQQKRLILFARTAPSEWPISLADLRSRIETILIAQIDAPDDLMIAELFANGFHARGVLVSPELIEYLIKRAPRSYAQIEGIIEALDQIAARNNIKVSRALARTYFEDQNE